MSISDHVTGDLPVLTRALSIQREARRERERERERDVLILPVP